MHSNGVLLLLVVSLLVSSSSKREEGFPPREGLSRDNGTIEMDALMPPYATKSKDEYLCTSVQLPERPMKLVGVQSLAEATVVHHILLFGCRAPAKDVPVWSCRMDPVCDGSESVLYGWGKNADPVHLPEGAGFSVGPGTAAQTIVLQVHYLEKRPEGDHSGVRLRLTENPVQFSAGLMAFAASFSIPPQKETYPVPNECCYSGFEPLTAFAYRVHTHSMGRAVTLHHQSLGREASCAIADVPMPSTQERLTHPCYQEVIHADPQAPQGFYPANPILNIYPGDRLRATCEFDSSNKTRAVNAGHTSADEMCNLYLMLYSEAPFFMWCLDGTEWVQDGAAGGIPLENEATPILEESIWNPPVMMASLKSLVPEEDRLTPLGEVNFTSDSEQRPEENRDVVVENSSVAEDLRSISIGQVSSIAMGSNMTLWAFVRCDRVWDTSTFGVDNRLKEMKAVECPTLIHLDRDTGVVLNHFGSKFFQMPHMVSMGPDGFLWVVDAGLHQVFKMNAATGEIVLALGHSGTPEKGSKGFCKPTHAIASRDGTLYVADGYCNARVAVFDQYGTYLREYRLEDFATLEEIQNARDIFLPHSLALDECRQRLYVADREKGKVRAINLEKGNLEGVWDVGRYGLPYAVRIGPYGVPVVLIYDRKESKNTFIATLKATGSSILSIWKLSDIEAPHDLEIVPAPLSMSGLGDRMFSVVVAATPLTLDLEKSNLYKFVLHKVQDPTTNSSKSAISTLNKELPSGLEASHAAKDIVLKRAGEDAVDVENDTTTSKDINIPNKNDNLISDQLEKRIYSAGEKWNEDGMESTLNKAVLPSEALEAFNNRQNIEEEHSRVLDTILEKRIAQDEMRLADPTKGWNLAFNSFIPSAFVSYAVLGMFAIIGIILVPFMNLRKSVWRKDSSSFQHENAR